jgi:hypothetical protein
MRDLEGHPKKRRGTLAVAVKITHDPKDNKDAQDRIQADGQKVINFRPLQPGLVETLQIENQEVSQQEQGEDKDIIVKRRNALSRIDGDHIKIKTEAVGPKIRNEDADNIAEDKKADEMKALFLDQVPPLSSAHLFSK